MKIEKLIKGCRNLDRKAQREMVNLLSPFLYSICRRYTENHHDAKDIMQDSLILIFNNIGKCKSNEESGFKSWCAKIAVNTALAKRRKKSYTMEERSSNDLNYNVSPKIHSRLHVEDILGLLQLLPEKQRNVFNLIVMDGFSHKEAASLLEIEESSSRTFLVRAREKMQQLIHQTEIK